MIPTVNNTQSPLHNSMYFDPENGKERYNFKDIKIESLKGKLEKSLDIKEGRLSLDSYIEKDVALNEMVARLNGNQFDLATNQGVLKRSEEGKITNIDEVEWNCGMADAEIEGLFSSVPRIVENGVVGTGDSLAEELTLRALEILTQGCYHRDRRVNKEAGKALQKLYERVNVNKKEMIAKEAILTLYARSDDLANVRAKNDGKMNVDESNGLICSIKVDKNIGVSLENEKLKNKVNHLHPNYALFKIVYSNRGYVTECELESRCSEELKKLIYHYEDTRTTYMIDSPNFDDPTFAKKNGLEIYNRYEKDAIKSVGRRSDIFLEKNDNRNSLSRKFDDSLLDMTINTEKLNDLKDNKQIEIYDDKINNGYNLQCCRESVICSNKREV